MVGTKVLLERMEKILELFNIRIFVFWGVHFEVRGEGSGTFASFLNGRMEGKVLEKVG